MAWLSRRVVLVVLWVTLCHAADSPPDPEGQKEIPSPIVVTSLGKIVGVVAKNEDGGEYFAFKGIRYGRPPTKKNRFKPSIPAGGWTAPVYMATADGHLCPQYNIGHESVIGDEDCLFLNVYSKKLKSSNSAVLVYIHGGSFINGGSVSYMYSPDYIINHDVVVVTIQYRLGAFGFLSTGDDAAAGNWGIHDIVLALKWVQDHIGSFGGDKTRVTLIGEDAGAAIINYLLVAKPAKGLFSSGITVSGNALCHQFTGYKYALGADYFAKQLDCDHGKTPQDQVDCLRRKPMKDLVTKANEMYIFYSFPRWFAPVVDGHLITDDPEKLMLAGDFTKVPMIVGQTRNEGGFYYRLILNSFNSGEYDADFIDNKLPRVLPVISSFQNKLYPVTRAVKQHYFKDIPMSSENKFKQRFAHFLTDLMFTRCTEKYMGLLVNNSVPTYAYQFDYKGKNTIVNVQGEDDSLDVSHGDDIQYLFSNIWGGDKGMKPSEDDVKFAKTVYTTLLTNFAKTQNPTPEVSGDIDTLWPVSTKESKQLFHINKQLTVDTNFNRPEDLIFWNDEIPVLMKTETKRKHNVPEKTDETAEVTDETAEVTVEKEEL